MNRLFVSALALLAGLSTALAQQTSTGSSSLGPIGFVQYPSSQRILSVSTSNSVVGLPPGNVVVIYNTGTNVADVALGDSSVKVVGAQYPVNPGTWRAFSVGTNTFIAAVGPFGSTTLSIQGGGGFPPNAVGGTSNGGNPPALTGNAAIRQGIGAAKSGDNNDITSLSALTTPLSIAQGGTGANDTASLRTNIGAAAAGINSDIITLNGLTTPLTIGQGGTGQNTLTGLRTALAAAATGANNDITALSALSTPITTAQGGTGGALGVGGTTFTATGGSSATSAADRATFGGVQVDLRADYGLKCDGGTEESAKLTTAINAINALSAPAVTVIFPGTCVVNWTVFPAFTKSVWLKGVNGGGVRLSASQNTTTQLFSFTGSGADYSVTDFTLDFNSATPTGTSIGFYDTSTGNLHFDRNVVKNAKAPSANNGTYTIQLYVSSAGSCRITNNFFGFVAGSPHQNQTAQIGGTVQHCLLANNRSANSGMAAFAGDYISFINNEVYGWGFGGGLTVGPANTTTPAHVLIQGNLIHDSSAIVDDNGTFINGIEQWFQGANVVGNSIYNTCGSSIGIGSQTRVIGNTMYDPWSCAGGGAYYTAAVTAIDNGGAGATPNGSFIDGNIAKNLNASNMTYGFSGTSTAGTITLGVNDFQGTAGAYNAGAVNVIFAGAKKDNRIVNPCGWVDQRNAGAAVATNNLFTADQWRIVSSSGAVVNYARTTVGMGNCPTSVRATVLATTVPTTSQFFAIQQAIPADAVQDLGWGQTSKLQLILGFCVKTSFTLPWTGSASLVNLTGPESYVVEYTIASGAVSNRQCFSYRIPPGFTPPTTGTGFKLIFDLGSGATNKTATLNTWTGNTQYGSTTSSDFISQANGATLDISDVRLYPGAEDDGWTAPTYDETLTSAQRFYQTSFPSGTAPAQSAGVTGALCTINPAASGRPSMNVQFQRPMNSTPTMTLFNPSAANASMRDTSASADVAATTTNTSSNGFLVGSTGAVTTAGDNICVHWSADAGL